MAATQGQQGDYRVKPGESLWGIARAHGVSLKSLEAANPQITNPGLIRAGDTVKLPGAAGGAKPHAGPASPKPKTPKPPRPAAPNGPSSVPGVSAEGFEFIYNHEHEDGVSRHLSWPQGSSGVTLGAGYDMGSRTSDEVASDLKSVGIPADQAEAASHGAGLKGAPAGEYVKIHAHDVEMNETQERALLAKELRNAVATVQSAVKVPLTQHQRDALVAFVFNIGPPHFQGSTTLRLLNQGDYAGACNAMKMWNKSGGKVMTGLVNRRADEMALFNKPDAAGPPAALPTAPTRGGAQPGPSGGGKGGDSNRYADIVARRGSQRAKADLDGGKIVLVGLRTPTPLNANGGNGVYDDTMVIVRKAGGAAQAETFRSNTEPSEQYISARNIARGKAPPDVNHDGRPDLGEIDSDQTVQYTMGTFLGHEALKADGGQMVRVRRDVNHDHRIDAKDPVSNVAGAGGMHIHLGGLHNTWSEGCQTLPPDEHARFFAALKRLAPQQRQFSYVLVDAPG